MQKSRCALTRRAANTNQPIENRLSFNGPTCYSRLTNITCTTKLINTVARLVSESFRGTTPISRERLKLETSNLAHILATWGPNEKKCKIRSNGVDKRSRDLLLEFWDPFHISGTVEARNFKFGTQIGHWRS